MTNIQYTELENKIIRAVEKILGRSKEAVIFVEDITKEIFDLDDDGLSIKNKSMLANMRHVSVKSQIDGPIVLIRDAPIKNGRRVVNGMGNKAAYIARKRKPH